VAEKPNYTLGHGDRLVRAFGLRDSTREAQFFLPHLKPGMSLLDCGCGPGTITVGLAKVVAPGHVTGIDIASEQFELGRRLAAAHDLTNVSFEQGDLTELRFDDASFDAVFAHGVLYHLSDPHVALNELRRVLRPGGLLGIRDTDEGGTLFGPRTPLLQRAHAAAVEAWRRNGPTPSSAGFTAHCCVKLASSQSASRRPMTTTSPPRRRAAWPSSRCNSSGSHICRRRYSSPVGRQPKNSTACAQPSKNGPPTATPFSHVHAARLSPCASEPARFHDRERPTHFSVVNRASIALRHSHFVTVTYCRWDEDGWSIAWR